MALTNPLSATKISLEYQDSRPESAADKEFNEGFEILKQIDIEDEKLCDAAQKNLNMGTYSAEQLELRQEVGVLHARN
jgi:hypothetical protein